jgi:uncharacterized repeat protein (TIGR01451 family)
LKDIMKIHARYLLIAAVVSILSLLVLPGSSARLTGNKPVKVDRLNVEAALDDPPSADLGVTKSGPDTVTAGANITYTITVINSGPDPAASTTLSDTLPATMTFVSLSSPTGWSCLTPAVGAGGAVTCTHPSLAITSGDVFTLVVNVTTDVSPGTFFTNTATISSTTQDPNDENNSSTAATGVMGTSAEVGVTKFANTDTSLPDRDVVYTITVSNKGPDAAADVTLNDTQSQINPGDPFFTPMPGTMTFVSLSSPAGWSCTAPAPGASGPVSCTKLSLAVSSDQVFTLVVHIPSGTANGTLFINTATVSSSTSDPNPDNNSYSAGTTAVTCLSNPVVTTTNDAGAGSLRQAISDACDGATITFDMNQVTSPITLTTGELVIGKNLTIQEPGANLLTVQRSTAGGTPLFSLFNIAQNVTVTISGLTLSNADSGQNGGAIRNAGTLTLTGLTLSNNHTTAGGAAIFNTGTGTATISNSTFSNNRADVFAAIYNQNGTLTISNSTLNGNTNQQNFPGAAIFSEVNTSLTNVTNCTISQNTGQGGAVFQNGGGGAVGKVNLKNSIVSGNSGGDVSGITDNGNNLIGGSPLLAPLSNYGGPTQTMALLPGSPAINAGTSTGAPTTDQRGISRVGAVDIGAFESRGFTVAATSGSSQSTPILSAFGSPLLATVSSAFSEPLAGGVVTFAAPSSGASGTFPGNVTTTTATIDAGGVATSPTFTANGTAGGPYNVVASIGTGLPTVNFALTNLKGNQTITFGALANKTFGDPDFTVSATATSGLTVSFAASSQCTVTGSTVHLTGAGSCTITASQAGDPNFNAATSVPHGFTIGKSNQTITFGALANKAFGDPDFSVSATATSGLPVSFTASGQCTVSGNTVHITSAGSCTITAKQAGDTNYNAAPDVAQIFTIANRALITLSQSNYNVNESTGFVTITVNRTGDLSVPVSVDYATDDTGSSNVCSTLNSGMASARCDFGLTLGTLKFAATETQKTFVIPITQDSYTEGLEMFTVNLSNLTGTGAAFATPSSATVTISDSAAPAPNASDDADAFVRQHYRDFLHREADPAGLAFWTNQIASCGNDAGCRDIKRINVSAAFFLSIEFQQSGILVRSFYVAALDRPLTNNMPAFVEFERDTQAVQRGVIVGQGNWQQTLNDNRDAFMKDFVLRAEFVGLYPTTDTPTQYVDKLYMHAAVTPATPAERQAAIDEFIGTTHPSLAEDAGARGRALLRVTQNAAFQQREMNRSFVQMEYFGYLRRNPNDAPDGNFAGYDFWVSKLNQFNGNFIQAEMVKAFIVSGEYRRRFGP